MQGKAAWILVLAVMAWVGCDALGGKSKDDEEKKSDKSKTEDKDKGGTRPASDAPAKSAEAPAGVVTDPSQQTYPEDGITKIADSCATAFALVATAPSSAGADYEWTWTRQAMLANQQFKVVDGDPKGPGTVSFQLHQASAKHNDAFVLLARCGDGMTCNKLVAMYKGVVKNAPAQPVCGTLPMELSAATLKKAVLPAADFGPSSVPKSGDVVSMCARLQACTVAMDPPAKAGKENIGFDCQKAPSNFKTDCARKYPCAEVMKCLGG
jgi:hypothetical protein